MSVKSYRFALSGFLLLCLSSCKTYYISTSSFKQQFAELDTTRQVTIKGPYGGSATYKTYPIDFVKCVDKAGKAVELKNGPSLEIRFTDLGNKRKIFYFDLLRVHGDKVTGGQSRFMPWITSTVSLSDVKTIEIQDGGKNFRYVE